MYIGPKMWELDLTNKQNLGTITAFKRTIKNGSRKASPCQQCKTYLPQVGFI